MTTTEQPFSSSNSENSENISILTNLSYNEIRHTSDISSQGQAPSDEADLCTFPKHNSPSQENNDLEAIIREISCELDIRKDMADRLKRLRDFEIVIVCDDSGSMKTPVDDTQRTRWDELCEIVKITIKIGVKFDANGVDVYFLNRQSYFNVKDAATVDEAFREPPTGFTPLVPVLQKIFFSKMADRERDKKVLVFVATDGVPTDDDGNDDLPEFRNTMKEKRLTETTYVSFLLCTDDPICVNCMREWDKQLVNVDVTDDFHTERSQIRKCQKDENYSFSYGDYVIKALVGAIDPEIDALNEPIEA